MHLKSGTWVAVCDGGKFLLLQNSGDIGSLDLRVVAHETIDAEALPERDGRGPSPDGTQARKGRSHIHSVEEIAEHRFIKSVSAELDERVKTGGIVDLVLIADQKTLGLLRHQICEHTQGAIRYEIGGDFAHDTVDEIEALLARQ